MGTEGPIAGGVIAEKSLFSVSDPDDDVEVDDLVLVTEEDDDSVEEDEEGETGTSEPIGKLDLGSADRRVEAKAEDGEGDEDDEEDAEEVEREETEDESGGAPPARTTDEFELIEEGVAVGGKL